MDELSLRNMRLGSQTRIVDIARADEYEKYLNRCLVGPASKWCKRRIAYLENAIPKGFRKKLLVSDGNVVGQIEYAPAEVSYYPLSGENLIVMNCIWVLRRAKDHDFGKRLLEDMVKSENNASGFATIALENHWSPWFRKDRIERLGLKSLSSIEVTHKLKSKDQVFSIHLMWLPNAEKAKLPIWNKRKLLEGITSCTAHPLYHPQTYETRQILKKY